MVWSIFIAGSSFPWVKQRQVPGETCFLVQPDGSSKDHDEQDGGGSDGEPAGVRTDIAGLNAADQ
jgi:hypothetical protein